MCVNLEYDVSTVCVMLMSCQLDFIPGDEVFVNAVTDEPINLVRPKEDLSIKETDTNPGTPRDTILITVKYLAEDDVHREIHCKMTKTMSFDRLISMYSKRWDLDASAQRLTFNGNTVFPSDTPALVNHQIPVFFYANTYKLSGRCRARRNPHHRRGHQLLRHGPHCQLSDAPLGLVQHIHPCSTTKPVKHGNNDSHDFRNLRRRTPAREETRGRERQDIGSAQIPTKA